MRNIQTLNDHINNVLLEEQDDVDLSPQEVPDAEIDQMADDVATAGTEQYQLNRFVKDFMVYNINTLMNRVTDLTTPGIQLPMGSVLHLIENRSILVAKPGSTVAGTATKDPDTGIVTYTSIDTPDIEKDVFIKNEKFRKFIYHVQDVNSNGPVPIDDKYIFLKMGQNNNIKTFQSIYNNRMKRTLAIHQLPKATNLFSIVNHCTLYRLFCRGILTTYRKTNIILGSVLNTMLAVSPEKLQFVTIDLRPETYDITQFVKSMHALDQRTLRKPNDPQYIFFVHLFNYLNPAATASIFNSVPQDRLGSLNVIFKCGTKAFICNMETLKELIDTPNMYRKFVNAINNLMEQGKFTLPGMQSGSYDDTSAEATLSSAISRTTDEDTTTITTTDGTVINLEDQAASVTDDSTAVTPSLVRTSFTKTTTTTKAISTDDDDDVPYTAYDKDVKDEDISPDDKNAVDLGEAVYEIAKETRPDEMEEVDEVIETDLTETDESNVAKFGVSSTAFLDTTGDSVLIGVPEDPDATDDYRPLTDAEEKTITHVHEKVFDPKTPRPTTEKTSAKVLSTAQVKHSYTKELNTKIDTEFLAELDSQATLAIDENTELTPKQKVRAKVLADKYKYIALPSGKTVGQLISEPVNPQLNKLATTDVLKDYVADESQLESSVINMDKQYVKHFLERDIMKNLVSFNKVGMFLQKVDVEDSVTAISSTKIYKCVYEDLKGKTHRFSIELPLINNDGTCRVNGTEYYFKKQLLALPICKLSETKVSLASSYNKTLVIRATPKAHNFIDHMTKVITAINATSDTPPIKIEYGYAQANNDCPYEYTQMATRYKELICTNPKRQVIYTFKFDFDEMFIKPTAKTLIPLYKQYGVIIGTVTQGSSAVVKYICMSNDNIVSIIDVKTHEVVTTSLLDWMTTLYEVPNELKIPTLYEWTDLKVLDRKIPVGMILAYKFGLRNLLDYLKMPYTVVPRHTRIYKSNLKPSDIIIPFEDKNLIVNRYPIKHSLIIAGLKCFDTSSMKLEDMEVRDTYFKLFEMKGLSTNLFKGIDSTFALFIDVDTFKALTLMGEPTTFKDLLIRATEMVSNDYFITSTSAANSRIRGYERIATIMFNELGKQYSAYMASTGGAGVTFSVPPKAVITRIMQDQAMLNVDNINPVVEAKMRTGTTLAGFGGRTSDSITLKDRKFTNDMVGLMSEATVEGEGIGINVCTTVNPKIDSVYGYVKPDEVGIDKDLSSSNMLSVIGMLMPGLPNDDGKRAMLTSAQLGHHLAVDSAKVARVRTGFERTFAHMTSDKFNVVAEDDGKVIAHDPQTKMLKIKYKNGEEKIIQYGEKYAYSSDKYIPQVMEATCKIGQSFKRGEVLLYDKSYFQKDPHCNQVDWRHGTVATVALIDAGGTFEDSSVLFKDFASRMSIHPTYERTVIFTKDSVVISAMKEGDHCEVNDYLMVLEDADVAAFTTSSEYADDTNDFLVGLNRIAPRAKYTGTIVSVTAYYGADIKLMHPTIQTVLKPIISKQQRQFTFSKGTVSHSEYYAPAPIPKDAKYKNIDFTEDTVVLSFLIKETIEAGTGDKFVVGNCVKSVVSEVADHAETESGIPVDMLFSGSSVSNRIVLSPLTAGIGERIMEQMEKNVLDMYFKD